MKYNCIQGKQFLNEDIKSKILDQQIFWSDHRLKHWSFDFKYNNFWIENIFYNNELNEVGFIITQL